MKVQEVMNEKLIMSTILIPRNITKKHKEIEEKSNIFFKWWRRLSRIFAFIVNWIMTLTLKDQFWTKILRDRLQVSFPKSSVKETLRVLLVLAKAQTEVGNFEESLACLEQSLSLYNTDASRVEDKFESFNDGTNLHKNIPGYIFCSW